MAASAPPSCISLCRQARGGDWKAWAACLVPIMPCCSCPRAALARCSCPAGSCACGLSLLTPAHSAVPRNRPPQWRSASDLELGDSEVHEEEGEAEEEAGGHLGCSVRSVRGGSVTACGDGSPCMHQTRIASLFPVEVQRIRGRRWLPGAEPADAIPLRILACRASDRGAGAGSRGRHRAAPQPQPEPRPYAGKLRCWAPVWRTGAFLCSVCMHGVTCVPAALHASPLARSPHPLPQSAAAPPKRPSVDLASLVEKMEVRCACCVPLFVTVIGGWVCGTGCAILDNPASHLCLSRLAILPDCFLPAFSLLSYAAGHPAGRRPARALPGQRRVSAPVAAN